MHNTPPKIKIFNNTLYLILGQIFSLILNIICIVVLARNIGVENFGLLSYAIVLVGFFSLLPDFGMKPIIVRELSRSHSNDEIVGNAIVLKLILTLLTILILDISILTIPSTNNLLKVSVLILSITLLFNSKSNSMRIVFESCYNAKLESRIVVFSQFFDAFFQLIFVSGLILLKVNYNILLIGYSISGLPGFIWITNRFLRANPTFHFQFNFKKSFWIVKESLPLFIYLVIMMSLERLDVFIIKYYTNSETLGIYSSTFRLISPLSFLPYAVTYSLYPILSSIDNKLDHKKCFQFGIKSLFYIGLAIVFGGVFVGKEIYLMIFGKNYAQGDIIFQLLIIAQISSFMCFYLIDYNNSQNHQKRSLHAILITLILSLPVQFYLIKKFYLIGAGISKILLYTLNLFILIILLRPKIDKEQNIFILNIFMSIVLTIVVSLVIIKLDLNMIFRFVLLLGIIIVIFNRPFFKEIAKILLKYKKYGIS
jgi:O-antigen/teichoic acid export membrane protein